MKPQVSVLVATACAVLFATALPAVAGYAVVCKLNPKGKNNLAVRSCPRQSCTEDYSLLPSDQVNIIRITGKYAYVRADNGAEGWVRRQFLCD
jgi:hypothetical protein